MFDDFIKEDHNIFGVSRSMEKFLNALVGELSLIKKLFVIFVACVDSLTWWEIHESQFPNVDSLTKQILGIPR